MLNRSARRFIALPLVVVLIGMTTMGCANMSRTEKGAAVGAGGGAAVGAIVGKIAGNTAAGALIGAAVGGTAGAVIGNRMDKQAKELEEQLAREAEVERVGEGILVNFDSALLFGFDSSELQPAARESLRKLAENLKQYPDTEVMVVGHTDSKGSDAYNQRLSERRAQAAATYLMEQGVKPSRIESVGKGETEPIASNDTPEGQAQNRRVEMVIYASEAMQQDAQSGS